MYYKDVKNNQIVKNVINEEELLGRVDGDYELLSELLSLFIEELPLQLQDIEMAIKNEDCEKLRMCVHRLKGAVGNLAAEEAYELAAQIELFASQGDLKSARYIYPNLKGQLRLVDEAIKKMINNNGF